MKNENAVTKNGEVIRTSKNLRGMRDYARTHSVKLVITERDKSNEVRGVLTVVYADGAQCQASFASFNIMIDWVRARRSWKGATIRHLNGDMGYLTKPGVISGV